jgi:hypothetical protein
VENKGLIDGFPGETQDAANAFALREAFSHVRGAKLLLDSNVGRSREISGNE